MPQSPTTTDGTAASMSISVPIGPRIDGGASSLRKRPIAIESGAEISIAPNDVTTVPMIRSRAPNWFFDDVPLVVPEERDVERLHRRPGAVGDPPDDREDDQSPISAASAVRP